jgi:hypothetical protein
VSIFVLGRFARQAFATSLHFARVGPLRKGLRPFPFGAQWAFPGLGRFASKGQPSEGVPMSTSSDSQEKRIPASCRAPSKKELRFLKSLAMQRGESFAYPQTAAEASAQIDRLKGRRRGSYVERRIEREQVSRDLSERGGDAAVRDSEIVGYGSSARWR